MSSNIKNYTEQGGERTVIGGELVIEEGAQVTGMSASDSAGAVLLDFGGRAISESLESDMDITDVVSYETFLKATRGKAPASFTNFKVYAEEEDDYTLSLYALASVYKETLVFFIPGGVSNSPDIRMMVSFLMFAKQIDGEHHVYLRTSFNDHLSRVLNPADD